MSIDSLEQAIRGKLKVVRQYEQQTYVDTGIGTTFVPLTPGYPFKLLEIRFKTAALAAGETLTITRKNLLPLTGLLTYLDYTILSEDLGTLGTLSLTASFGEGEGLFTENDSIDISLSANVGADRWGLEIKYEKV